MMTAEPVQLFMLSYNRPEMALAAIKSVLNQTYKNFELIISDNSTKQPIDTTKLPSDSRIKYLRRSPSLPAQDHFTQVKSEATSNLYMLLHDDDLLMPGLLKELVSLMQAHTQLAAASANAYFIFGDQITRIKFNPNLTRTCFFESPRSFLTRYLLPTLGVNPYPAYIYRNALVKSEPIGSMEAGKYSDATYLTRLLSHGPIAWLDTPLFYYRTHGDNDSAKISIRDAKKLIQWSLKTNIFHKEDRVVIVNRIWYLFLKVREKRRKQLQTSPRAVCLILKFILLNPIFTLKLILLKGIKALQRRLTVYRTTNVVQSI